ncbi:fimbrial protein [Kluyvera intermedia]|uniref:fimbrial protein n=1 Tax=Kluyvera intermedia TaxID=61648 RepID=UPI003523ACEA
MANTATITVKGNVTLNTCSINGGADINVPFGDVMTNRIDGKDYEKTPVPYSVNCDTGDAGITLRIAIKGAEASFGEGLLQTNVTGLGIQFVDDSGELPLNKGATTFEYLSEEPPPIYAVLAKDPSVTLSGGAFAATATMYVNYL